MEIGKYYWIKNKKETIWRICYTGLDCDNNLWLHFIGTDPTLLSDLDLTDFNIVLINDPSLW